MNSYTSDQVTKLQVLNKYLGQHSPKSSTNVAFNCPFCGHPKKKLEIDVQSGLWNCWVCKTSGYSITKLLKKVNASVIDLTKLSKLESSNVNYSKVSNEIVSLPNNFIPFSKCQNSNNIHKLLKYLELRNISEQDIVKYNIGYLDDSMNSTIVIPSYDSQFRLNYYISKNIYTNRYNNPKCSKDKVFLESFVDWNYDIVIVEGIFDAIAVKRNVIPLFGKFLNDRVKEKIVSSSSQNFYIALDGGEYDSIFKIAKYIIEVGKNAYFVNIPIGEDPSSLGNKTIWEFISNSERITENDIYKYKLYAKLDI
jgi:transcription elongation factor Elf1